MRKIKEKTGLMASSFLMMSFLVPNSVLAEIAADFPEVPLQTVQMITTMPSLVSIVLALAVGKITAYVYKRTLILISTFFYLAGGLLPYFFHRHIGWILAGAAVLGIGLGIMMTCVAALICDCCSEKESSRLLGIQAAFISGGGLVFIWLGGQLGKTRWENAFLAYILVIAVIIIDFICLPKGKLDRRSGYCGRREKIPGRVWFYALSGFVLYVFVIVYNTNISVLVNIRGLGGPVEASWASMCYTFAGMIAGCMTGFLISRFGQYIFLFSSILALAGMSIAYVGGSLWMLCLAGMFCGAAFSSFTPAGNFYAAESAGKHNRSVCIAVFTSVSNLGQALSPVLVAWLMKPLSIEQRFAGAAAAFVLVAAVTFAGGFRINHLDNERRNRFEK